MTTLTAATWVAALLLVIAGAGKLASPAPTVGALRAARVPANARVVRLIGAGEVMLGLATVLLGGALACALVAVAYAAFAAVARRQRRAGSDCGCFGTTGAPVTGAHVAVNAGAAVVAAGAALRPTVALPAVVGDEPLLGAALVLLVGVAASLLRLLLTAAPDLATAAARLAPEGAP